jgi:CheY-like chemotaxis protein
MGIDDLNSISDPVIRDCPMQGMTGIEFLEELRLVKGFPRTKEQ